MGSFVTGFFTLVTALLVAWQHNYLDRKKTKILTLKEKAIEAYAGLNKIGDSILLIKIFCDRVVESDEKFNINSVFDANDRLNHELEQLEITVIANFYDLFADFLKINSEIRYQVSLMCELIIKKNESTIKKYQSNIKDFETKLMELKLSFQDRLRKEYINVPNQQVNIYQCWDTFIKKCKVFFSKPKLNSD